MQRFFAYNKKETQASKGSSAHGPAAVCTLRLVSVQTTVSLAVRFDTLAKNSKYFEQMLNNMNEEELAKRELLVELTEAEDDVIGAAQLIEALHAYSGDEEEMKSLIVVAGGGWNKTWATLACKWSISSLVKSFAEQASSELTRLLTINDLITTFNQPSLEASELLIVKNCAITVVGSGCESMNGCYTYTTRKDKRGFSFSRRGEFQGMQGRFFLFPRKGVIDKKCRWYMGFYSKESEPLAPLGVDEEDSVILFSAPAMSSFSHFLPPPLQWGKEAQALVHNLSQFVVEIKMFQSGGVEESEHKEPPLGDVDRKNFWNMAEFLLASSQKTFASERDLLLRTLGKHVDLFDDDEMMSLLSKTHLFTLLKQLKTPR